MDMQLLFFSPRSYSVSFAKFRLVFDCLETKLGGDRGQLKCQTLAISCIYKIESNMCRMVAVLQFSNFLFFYFLFEKAEKERRTFAAFANIFCLQSDN